MKKNKGILVIVILLLTTAAVCGFLFAREYMSAQEEMSEYADVQNEYTSVTHEPIHEPGDEYGDDLVGIPSETEGLPYITADFSALLHENPDTVGWVAIPGTTISYPVVQANDNSKYLNISFQGRRSGAGTPFADKDNNMRDLDANTVIYGHNMGAGRQDMFGMLLLYKDNDFFTTYRFIQFDTIHHCHGWWKVFAVIEHDIRTEGFLYQQLRFESGEDFKVWIERANELSIHESDTEIQPNDLVLTLSTCDRSKYGKYGRLLVLAVKMGGHQ